MGEKESADFERKSGSIISGEKQAPDKKKDDEQAYVQDNSPNPETARQGDTAKDAIQNMR